jgi:hypothetical protein
LFVGEREEVRIGRVEVEEADRHTVETKLDGGEIARVAGDDLVVLAPGDAESRPARSGCRLRDGRVSPER